MAKQELKTKKTKKSVAAYLNSVENDQKRADSKKILSIMKEITGEKPAMWGPSMIGFGTYHYKRSDGSEHKYFITGFAPRKTNITLYLMAGYKGKEELLSKLGPYKRGAGCLYIKRLEDIHIPTLKKLIRVSMEEMKKRYKTE